MRSDLRIGMALVVDHLIFVGDRAVAILGHEVFHAAVGAEGDLPFELQIEIVEGVDGDDVAAALRVGPFGNVLQPTVLDDPAFVGKRRLLETAPPGRRLAVEERPRAEGGLSGRGVRVALWSGRGRQRGCRRCDR